MATKIKGLYSKSFMCFSDIFDVKEEEEMEIGHPTNVKHVAHIGWDNSSSGAPGWLNDFNSSHDVSKQNSTWPFDGFDPLVRFQSGVEIFNEVPSNKDLQTESKTKKWKKKFSSSISSPRCYPWTPRSSRPIKLFAKLN